MTELTHAIASTHQVFNQPPPLENYNAFHGDRMLQYWLRVFGAKWAEPRLMEFGHQVGHELLQAGFQANKHIPEFLPHDRFGHRIDQVDYHPAYHQLMQAAITAGHTHLPWTMQEPGTHVARAALAYLHNHADPGSGCPLTMTFASVPAIQTQPDVASCWLPGILSGHYDGSNKPWYEKVGLTIGMAMTEKQGGSDVRANTTVAVPVGQPGAGQLYSLLGHKWFCSAPMCDGFLMLAKVEDQLSCFLVPRWREDGSKNPIHIQRLKNKLGNRSNASAEIELRGAHGWLVGEQGRGVATIIQMVALTRYDCMIGSSALMAQAAKEAIWHTAGRSAFGRPLHLQPLMLNVLADLALEAEASLAISMRIAHALDNMQDAQQAALVRCATGIGKYWVCKRAVLQTFEAMECVGGVGYVDENVCNRLYREAPVNSIWEGSGNVQCLDLLRVLSRESDCLNALIAELEAARGRHPLYDRRLEQTLAMLVQTESLEYAARHILQHLALCWQAATLLLHGEGWIAEAFVRARLGQSSLQFGCLPEGINTQAIVERLLVRIDNRTAG
ncbi:acyl-CoA dehydrogenase family protein [Bowmanella yangjiangensis]|uniref:Acyl-CoA dehydrogenase family protein n=1 Tax=Bowmanella yangjiangensis TaxID=2811230 RepID=A0ABS3CZA3_9ALTE|nr:acyl-CoA dehydrogenase family protein [Bowmanella yangjiangensis]MBN7821726.1 acyl-CoA dehydrogenase family protein [Bowmanella yangjiangensis]